MTLGLENQKTSLGLADGRFPIADFGFVLLLLFWLASAVLSSAQPKSELAAPPPLSPAEGERQAHALIDHLLAQKPDQSVTNTGMLKLRDAQGNTREIPARFDIVATPTNWLSVYSAAPGANFSGEVFTVIHTERQPNQYRLANGITAAPHSISGNQLMVPFAGSDFWLSDLGLEFLQWPQQRIVKKQMRKNLFCDVLQSTNPKPAPGAYSRVVSWVAANRPDEIVVVHADAYDAQGKLLKEFDPKRIEKVNGAWQLEEMEIRNRETGTRTRIEFNLDH